MAKKLKTSTKGYKKSSPDKNEPALRIPSGRITMKDVPFPVLGIDNYGNSVIMQPGEEYQFPGSEVIEMPVLQTGGRAPIYTSNPNDPRLRAYNDSLAAYNSYVSDDEFFSQKAIFKNLNQQRYYPEAVFNNAAIGVSKSKINPIGYNNYNYSSNIEWEGLPKSRLSIPVYKKPVQPVVYQEPQQAPVKRKQQVPVKKKQPTYEDSLYAYKKGLSVIKEHIKDAQSSGVPASLKVKPLGDAKEYAYENYTVNGVRPIGRYTTISDDYLLPAYKKPVGTPQPQEPKIDAPKKRQTSYARDLSIVPIEAAKPTVSQSLYDSSKPTNWSFTYPTGQYNEQKTMYFPDRDSWKKFVDQQKLSNSQETSEQGTATGYMKKGGLTPNKAREILHDGKVHGKKLTEKQRRFFGAMSKGHTKKYQIGGNLGKAAASASTTDEQLVLKKNEDYLKNIGLVHYANASRKPISSNFEYIPDFDESLQFIKNWYGSPEALDRMTKLVGKRTLAEKNMESAKENVENTFVFSDPERVKNIIKQYESRMTYAPESEKKQLYDELIRLDVNRISALEAKRDFYGDMIDKNKGFSAGFFNANGSIVNINEGLVKTASDFGHPLQKQSRETLKRTSVHELSHASGMDKLMKKFEPKPLHKSVKNAIEMGFVVPRIKELSKELEGKQPDRDYLESDTFYPRIMELRFIHGIKPGDTIDKKKLEEIKKNPKSAKNPLFRYYGDDDIIWMMNNLVKANNNSNTENTMKKGGIHIDPKNKGKFTKSAKAAGMGVQEFARHVLANKEDYSPTQVKRANFARNAKKWSAQKGFVVPSGETWQFDPITGEPMGAPEKWRNEDDPVTIPGLKEHLAKIKAGVPTYPFKTTGNEGSVQNPMGAGAPDNGPEKKPSKNYLPTLNAINFGLTKFAESLRNKELERYNRQMIALQNVPQPRRLTRIEQYGDPSVYQIGGMIPEDVSYLMGTIPNFDMLPTPAKSSSGMDNVVQGAIKGTTQQAKGTPVPGSDYENVIYNTYIENGLTPQAALFLTAQTMHETADYSSNVFKQNNNVAGIKIPRKRKSPFIEGVGTAAPANESKDQKYNKYAKYKDVKSGAMDLLEWMKYNKIDPNKFNTPEEYAEALRQKSYFGNTEEGKKIYVAGLQNKIKKLKKKGFEKGGEYDLSDSEIAELKAQGYDIEIID